jgi:putative DNA methylase
MKDDKRLIEDYLPIEAISKEASREKSVRKGHISTLHLWWARRPLVACRAAVYGALVPASRFAWSNESKRRKGSGKDLGRAEAEKFVEKLCKYPGDPGVIAEAREHILEAHADRLSEEQRKEITATDIIEGRAPRPKVLDMFAGGGAIPLEALRLGCDAYALDLNPVAHVIELCTLVYPQKYGKPEPGALGMTGPKNAKGETTWGGLAEEVRYWANWVLERVRTEVGDLYPLIPDPKGKKRALVEGIQPHLIETGAQQKLKLPPGYLTPVAYLWTRTVTCKNRSCGATVPLVRQTWLCTKKDRYVALRMIAPRGEKSVRFKVVEATAAKDLGFDPEGFSKGGNATCPFCGTVANSEYVMVEGCAKRAGQQLMAIVCRRPGERELLYFAGELDGYIPYPPEMTAKIKDVSSQAGIEPLNEPINPTRPSPNARGMTAVTRHGITEFGDLFSQRQLLCLFMFVAKTKMAESAMLQYYGSDHALAILCYLGVFVDRTAQINCSVARWRGDKSGRVEGIFGMHAVPMVWDFAEMNPFGGLSNDAWGNFVGVLDVIENASRLTSGNVQRGSATALKWPDACFDAVITDPPYYDNVPYADVSDFFYVWLKRTVGHRFPDHFSGELTPKKNEATALASRHSGNMAIARTRYESMMFEAFCEAHRVLKSDGQLVVVYAHKTTLGWATLVDALRRANFTVTEAWPLDTEMSSRLAAMDTAALASSIFLTARKRVRSETGAYETEVRPELEAIVRERVETLWRMGITGADLVIAAVGAGLRAFTQYERVEYANGEDVPAERFLAEVEGVVLEAMLEKIFGISPSGVSSVDGPSRFYVLWRYTYKAADLDAGEAIVFTYGQPVELDGPGGVATGRRPLVEKKKSQYRLYDFSDRGDDEALGLPNEDGESAPLIDVLHRSLWLMENKPRSLPRFLDEARPDRERLRLVAQALAGPGLKGKSDGDTKTLLTTTTGEQAALGKLLANWRTLIDSRLEEFSLR